MRVEENFHSTPLCLIHAQILQWFLVYLTLFLAAHEFFVNWKRTRDGYGKVLIKNVPNHPRFLLSKLQSLPEMAAAVKWGKQLGTWGGWETQRWINVFACQVSYWEVVNIYRIICIMARPCALCSTQGITGMWPNSCLNLHYLWNVENISDDFWSNSHTAPLWLTKIYVGNFTALWNEDAVNVSVLTVCPFFPSRKFSNKKNFSLWQICN